MRGDLSVVFFFGALQHCAPPILHPALAVCKKCNPESTLAVQHACKHSAWTVTDRTGDQ